MYIYLVNYWVPFPSSEYGGLQCVIAKDDEACARILAEESSDLDRWPHPDALNKIKSAVMCAQRYTLAGEQEEGIVKEFIT